MEQLPIARLLSAAARTVVEEMHEQLSELGHPDLRPAYGYALNFVADEAATAAQLATALGMTKQGAAKLVASLERLGYLNRGPHGDDGRARALTLTARGRDLLRQAESVQRRLEAEWAEQVGPDEVRALRGALEARLAYRYGEARPPLRPLW